ncbi:hypothetical protein [Algoriphagus sp.]|uniref:hypothetical protein n=1 Tax=Algoriphagus sp. TaxID=1872435 RepID=UPI00260BFD71|nr:hypothetical protein [Algoriphagus sp.]
MDMENYEFLTEKLMYSGFEDKLNAKLKEAIEAGKEDFILTHRANIESKQLDVDLYFKKSQISDRYFFNKYEAKLQHPESGQEPRTHTFYQNQGITLKEAFNLLEGRAVYKSLLGSDKETYKAWLQLDLSKKDEKNNFVINKYFENYGFDLKAALAKFPIKELGEETKLGWMLKSLQKGNTFPVVMVQSGREEIMYVEANPKFKSINLYDVSMNSVKQAEVLEIKNSTVKNQKEVVDSEKKKDLKKENSKAQKTTDEQEDVSAQKAAKPRKSRGKAI